MNSKRSREYYVSSINKVIDYLDKNLDKNLSLEELSNVGMFSKFYFHRIFKSIIGESVYAYTKRLRLEKALELLKYFKDYPITKIALEVGFSSSANFSSAFKEYYGITPSGFKSNSSILLKPISNTSFEPSNGTEFNVEQMEIKDLPDYNVIYIRHIGSYAYLETTWGELLKIASEAGVNHENTLYIGIPYDDPQITFEEKLRYDACLAMDQSVVHENVGSKRILGGLYGVYNFNNKLSEVGCAYDSIINEWLPESGYLPDDRNSFQIYKNGINLDSSGYLSIDICIPLRKIP